jgi:hypothetical protein
VRFVVGGIRLMFIAGDDVNEALSLLRGVIHESARFLLLYEDPSVLFAEPLSKTLESVSISSPCTPRKKWYIGPNTCCSKLTSLQQM